MVVLAVFCSVGQVSDLGCIFIVVQLIRFFSLPEFGEELIFVRSMWAVNYAHAYWFLPTSKIVVRISSITSKNIYSGFIVGRLNIFQYFHCLNYRRQLCCILGIRTKNMLCVIYVMSQIMFSELKGGVYDRLFENFHPGSTET